MLQNGIIHPSHIHKHYEDNISFNLYDTSKLRELTDPNVIKLIPTDSFWFFCEKQKTEIMHTIQGACHMRRYVRGAFSSPITLFLLV